MVESMTATNTPEESILTCAIPFELHERLKKLRRKGVPIRHAIRAALEAHLPVLERRTP